MSELREVVAKNICELRQQAGMTQLMLAEKLSYSDKAVSKWERGESFPDIFMLKKIADLFLVSVDYLFAEDHSEALKRSKTVSKIVRRNRMLISFLASMLVWLIATVLFVALGFLDVESAFSSWLVFIYATPLCLVVALVFNSIWGIKKLNYLMITLISWTLLTSVHITFLALSDFNIWIIYVIGIPVQIIIFLWSGLSNPKKSKKTKGAENGFDDASTPQNPG